MFYLSGDYVDLMIRLTTPNMAVRAIPFVVFVIGLCWYYLYLGSDSIYDFVFISIVAGLMYMAERHSGYLQKKQNKLWRSESHSKQVSLFLACDSLKYAHFENMSMYSVNPLNIEYKDITSVGVGSKFGFPAVRIETRKSGAYVFPGFHHVEDIVREVSSYVEK